MLSQFDKRDNSGNPERGSNDMSPGETLAIVIAALTLLVAMIPLFRCSRFHRWVSSLILPFVKKAFGISPPKPALTAVITTDDSSAIPAPEIPIPGPVFIYNRYSNSRCIGTCSGAFVGGQNDIAEEDGRVPQAEESLALRRPERVVTYPFP
ncbi:hypothetical protein B9Z19DRAFT_1129388 [Tuber borchii]|uniref:Uncharacterized protein n=1 Tax=Tuber borchii TaxID=42251 RepID=A0A2T6ZML4_TUBBO|nr:hypothetical protein B9Z19DRAFT_1129388 [Tuber borchii]